jgi:hypothetical protein
MTSEKNGGKSGPQNSGKQQSPGRASVNILLWKAAFLAETDVLKLVPHVQKNLSITPVAEWVLLQFQNTLSRYYASVIVVYAAVEGLAFVVTAMYLPMYIHTYMPRKHSYSYVCMYSPLLYSVIV